MTPLIIWNDTKYAQILAEFFGKDFVITDSEVMIQLFEKLDNYNSLVVLCELDWNLKGELSKKQKYEGIELVKELRRNHEIKLNLPVLFVSFQPLSKICTPEREILQAIGHDFVQLPVIPQEIKSILAKEFSENGTWRKLSEMELDDIRSNYCSKEGILSNELHALNHYKGEILTAENNDKLKLELENFIIRIYTLFLGDYETDLVKFHSFWATLEEGASLKEAVERITHMGSELLNNFGENSKIIDLEKGQKNYRWKVLLLDDQIDEGHELIKQLHSNNINVICVNNAGAATDELKKDWKNENSIMVVIADYRLFEKGVVPPRHQKIQGYQFLKSIAATDHLIRLVAFSGLQRKFLFKSFKHFNIRTEIKSKSDYILTKETRQIFCEEIKELAEENWEAIEALPNKCAGFEKYLQSAYKEFRKQKDYTKMENNISMMAKEYALEIQQQISNGEDVTIKAIDYITSTLKTTKKDEEAYFKRFQNYMIGRRVCLWFYDSVKRGIINGITFRKFAEILTGNKYDSEKKNYSDGAYRQIFSTNLGLSLDDFPKNITIEERCWLQYEMQLNIFRDIEKIDPVFIQLAKNYKDFFHKDSGLKKAIENNNFRLTHKYKQNNYSINFESNLSPIIKTATDVRVLFLIIEQYLKKEKNKVELIKPLVSRLRLSLFQSRNKVIYLKNLFQYFNFLNGILNKEKSLLRNHSEILKDKSDFTDKSDSSINKVYERVYELLTAGEFPTENDKTDVWTVYVKGEDVIKAIGLLTEDKKTRFFFELSKVINRENESIGVELKEGRKTSKSSDDDFENEVDYSDFIDFE